MTHPADRLAFDRAMAAQPVWNRFDTGGDALGLAENVLLHAGPAFEDHSQIPKPVMNSASVAAVYEGLAPDFPGAEGMIRAGEIVLEPAQDRGVVVPLAAVISASMPLHSVYDAWRGDIRCFAPINGGVGPSLRLGLCNEAVLKHIRWLNTRVRDVLQSGIAEGIELVPMAAEGVRQGDDCHGYTPAAGAALVQEIWARRQRGIDDEEIASFMEASPSLFLNLWMAATKVMMKAAEGIEGSALVTAAGGNGHAFGVQVSGMPGRWFTCTATPPVGNLDAHPPDLALGAIGDSAVVDCFGLGAMAFSHVPVQMAQMQEFLPENHGLISETLGVGSHPYFRGLHQKLGCSVSNAVKAGQGPMISLGVLDRNGQLGRLGGGIYNVPLSLCAEIVDELSR